jgi:hypothetical protein
MDKATVLELSKYTLNKLVRFSEYYKNENLLETSFSDWNVRDVIAHINSWVKFSEDKLESIKRKRSFEDVNHVDIEKFNKTNYENNKDVSLEKAVNETKIIMEKYKDILKIFDEKELLSKEFPTGFSFELWKYMVMDVYIHPITHILYHYIKRNDYNEFIKLIKDSEKYFMEYSNNDIKVYYLGDLFENKHEKEKRFKELREIINDNKDEIIEKIIKINTE